MPCVLRFACPPPPPPIGTASQVVTDGEVTIEFLLQHLLAGDRFLRQTGLWYVGLHGLLSEQKVFMSVARIAEYDMVGELRTEAKLLLRSFNRIHTIGGGTVEIWEDCLVEEECQIAALLQGDEASNPVKGLGTCGARARVRACIRTCGRARPRGTPPRHAAIPPFPETGVALRRVQAAVISHDFVVRVVDKGAGQLWGFCKRWVWDSAVQFLADEGYTRTYSTVGQYTHTASSEVTKRACAQSPRLKITRMYLTGNAKGLWAGKGWLWRPVTASPQSIIAKPKLKVCAHAVAAVFCVRGAGKFSALFRVGCGCCCCRGRCCSGSFSCPCSCCCC